MAKKPNQSKRNGQSIPTDTQRLRSRAALGMPPIRSKPVSLSRAKTAKPPTVKRTVPEAKKDPRVQGRSGRTYKNSLDAFVGEWSDPNSPARRAVSRALSDIGASRDKMLRGAEEKANKREAQRQKKTSNMEAPDMRRLKTPAVTVNRPATAAAPPAARPAPASSTVARPVSLGLPLPPRRPTPSTLPAGGYPPPRMSGDYSTPQPGLDTNKGYEPNKTGFFDKLHRSLGGKGNATYKYPTGDNRSDKD